MREGKNAGVVCARADRDGRLQVCDQILVINGRPLEAGMSWRQALAWLQMPGRTVDLTVARERPPGDTPQTSLPSRSPPATADAVRRPQRQISTSSGPPAVVPSPTRDCDVTFPEAEWAHAQEIQLLNDGSGLGFGIVGGKTAGVVVRTLIGGGVADRVHAAARASFLLFLLRSCSRGASHQDGRLRAGDRILRIGATPTDGLSSDQVVQVLRACGSRVTMLVARDRGAQKSKEPPPPPPDSAPVSFPRQSNKTVSGRDVLSSTSRCGVHFLLADPSFLLPTFLVSGRGGLAPPPPVRPAPSFLPLPLLAAARFPLGAFLRFSPTWTATRSTRFRSPRKTAKASESPSLDKTPSPVTVAPPHPIPSFFFLEPSFKFCEVSHPGGGPVSSRWCCPLS